MKIIKYLTLFIISFLFLSLSPKAITDNCSDKEDIELSRAASQIKTGYTYKEIQDERMINGVSVEFTINVYNMSDLLYLEVYGIPGTPKTTYTTNNAVNGVINIPNLSSYTQNTYTLMFKSKNSNCLDKVILNKQIVTPKYNEYSQSTECADYPKFSLCQKFYNTNVTYEEFSDKLDSYIESLEEIKTSSSKENKKDEKNIKEQLVQIYKSNKKTLLYTGLSIIVIALITGIVIMIRKRMKIK